MKRFAAAVAVIGVGFSASPAWAQMDWLTPHLDAQRANNLLQHQQRMINQGQETPSGETLQPSLPQVVDRSFTVFVIEPDGTRTTRHGTTVPHLPRQGCWEWGIRLEGHSGAVDFVETLTLPAPAGSWEGSSATIYSEDGRSAVKHSSLEPQDGWIGNAWCVAEGDPVGAHSILVEIGGAIAAEFAFTVDAVN